MNEQKIPLLYVDDEPAYAKLFLRTMADDERFEVRTAGDGVDALDILKTFPAQIILTDLLMPRMDGLALLQNLKEQYPDIFVLLITGVDSAAKAVEAMKAGAYDYLVKPLDMTMVKRQLDGICHHLELLKTSQGTATHEFRFENLIGKDRAMFAIYQKIAAVSATDSTVLITGESGTGKELIAEAIHARSQRKDRPFIRVNCAALTETLINSALFGHEKGAFTGASTQKKGFFEEAHGGTILLDEIGDIPITTQVALLRVLELGSFQRVGGTRTIEVDVRIICSTNRNLGEAVQQKTFRDDLYYRINVITLHAPPLHERVEDIPLLAGFFLKKYSQQNNKAIPSISPRALTILKASPWPGNVRELANAIEHAAVFCNGRQIDPEHLPVNISQAPAATPVTFPDSNLATVESTLIRQVLTRNQGNLSSAARELGIARGTLYSKMQKYGIDLDT